MKLCSIFSQVLKLFSRGEFERAVKEHKAERHARGFTSWGQFMAMMFCSAMYFAMTSSVTFPELQQK